MDVLIPKQYRPESPVAVTYNQYAKVTSTAYLDKERGLYLIKVTDHMHPEDEEDDEKLFGPFDMRMIETTHHVIEDVLWKAGKKT